MSEMKIEGLTFLEALEALYAGKCGGVKRKEWDLPYRLTPSNGLTYMGDPMSGWHAGIDSLLASDWELVDAVVPEPEPVTREELEEMENRINRKINELAAKVTFRGYFGRPIGDSLKAPFAPGL